MLQYIETKHKWIKIWLPAHAAMQSLRSREHQHLLSPGHTQVAPARRGKLLPSAGVNLSCKQPWTVRHMCSPRGQHHPSGRQPVPSNLCAATGEIPLCHRADLALVQEEGAALPGCHSSEHRAWAARLWKEDIPSLTKKTTIFFSSCLNERVPRRFLFLLWNFLELTRMWLLCICFQACELKGKVLLTSSQRKGLSLGVPCIFTSNAKHAGIFLLIFPLVYCWEQESSHPLV